MMSSSHPPHDEPELVPPAELLRLRALLSRSPDAGTRTRHLAAVTSAAREGIVSSPAGRFARRGVRVAAAVVASLAITSGLAGAQLLPQPAQRLLSSVGERLSPSEDAPPAPTADAADQGDGGSEAPARGGALPLAEDREQLETTTTQPPTTTSTTTPPTSEPSTTTTTEPPASTTTTIPGPGGPGSPDDPTDPGSTDGGSTDGGSTDGVGTAETDGGTDGGGSTGTTSTTEVPPEGPTTTVGGSD